MLNDINVVKCPYYNTEKCQSTTISNMTTRCECPEDFSSLINLPLVGLTARSYIRHMNKVMYSREYLSYDDRFTIESNNWQRKFSEGETLY